jgi:hypothetical protein
MSIGLPKGTHEPYYIVVHPGPFERPVEPQGLPTPRLISQGGGEAYFVPWDSETAEGQWRARDDSYDPPGTTYTRVRVIRNPKFQDNPFS